MANTLTKQEQLDKIDRQLEQLVLTTIRQNNDIDRASALKLIAKRALRKATNRLQRGVVEPLAISTV